MKERNHRSKKWLALMCAGVVWITGCFTRKPPKATFGHSWALQPPYVAPWSGELEPPPEIAVDPVEFPEELAMVHPPARPRVASAPVSEPAKAEPEPEPRITPEFTPEEQQAAQAETQRNLELIDKNLTLSSGKSLNASQQDLASKVRGFADNAREAMKSGDWVRAKNLSKKAEVLSEELAASL